MVTTLWRIATLLLVTALLLILVLRRILLLVLLLLLLLLVAEAQVLELRGHFLEERHDGDGQKLRIWGE